MSARPVVSHAPVVCPDGNGEFHTVAEAGPGDYQCCAPACAVHRAAPELLEALRDMYRMMEQGFTSEARALVPDWYERSERCRALIAKLEGGQS